MVLRRDLAVPLLYRAVRHFPPLSSTDHAPLKVPLSTHSLVLVLAHEEQRIARHCGRLDFDIVERLLSSPLIAREVALVDEHLRQDP